MGGAVAMSSVPPRGRKGQDQRAPVRRQESPRSRQAVKKLKYDPAIQRVALSGSVSVVRQLLEAGLLDELHLLVHRATAGSGLQLFEEGGPARHLRLISAQPFQTGVV